MSQPESRDEVARPESKSITKKPYLKPEVRHEQVFETMALACGKIKSTQGTCRHNRKNS